MKLKPCTHPEATSIGSQNGKLLRHCAICGALQTVGEEWQETRMMKDPKRFIVVDPGDLPPHADRRAWETFHAGAQATAVEIIASENPGVSGEDKRRLAAKLAGLMADDSMLEWEERFGAVGGPSDASQP